MSASQIAGATGGLTGGTSSATLQESYAFCERVARTQAKNFYYSFLLLTRARRQAMCAIYAFMGYCDDLRDDESIRDRAAGIALWRQDQEAALNGRRRSEDAPVHPLWPA